MFTIHTDTRPLIDFAHDLGIIPSDLIAGAERALAEASLHALQLAKAKAPKFTGHLANHITVSPPSPRIAGGTIHFVSTVQTNSPPYDIVMEEGRRPGQRQPPIDKIERWVALKVRRGEFALPGKVRSKETQRSRIRRAAYLVAQSIAAKGTTARHYMRGARRSAEIFLAVRIEEMIDRVYQKWYKSL